MSYFWMEQQKPCTRIAMCVCVCLRGREREWCDVQKKKDVRFRDMILGLCTAS